MSLLSLIFLYIIQSSANSRILDSAFLQISLISRDSRGPNTLPYGTPEVNLTFSDSCPCILTLCERPKRNSFIHTTTFKFLYPYNYPTFPSPIQIPSNSFTHKTTLKFLHPHNYPQIPLPIQLP